MATSQDHHGVESKIRPEPADDSVLAKPNLKGDIVNIFLLLLLYTIQTMPLGLSMAIPIILQSEYNASYQDQALFSLSSWPFSLKLLWAPLVDALYVRKMGKRKSWIVPVQYLIGTILLYMAYDIHNMLPENGEPKVMSLVCICFALNFLAATQDLAVDGWALTMLKKNNVGYASSCNSTGLAIGMLLSYVVPILLTSSYFCNKYLRITPDVKGLMTMQSFLYSWSITFLLVTTLIMFKREKDYTLENDFIKLSIVKNYILLWNILKLPSIRILAIALLTARIGFAVTDNVVNLKLIHAGVSKDDITVIITVISGVNTVMQLFVANYTSGPKSMSIYMNSIPFKLILNVAFGILIYYTPKLVSFDGVMKISTNFYVIFIILLSIQQVLLYIMLVAPSAFSSRISDPRFGATYLTLLNTFRNLGNSWTSTLAFEMVNLLTSKECSFDSKNNCSTADLKNMCTANNKDRCITAVDGFYTGTTLCTLIGIVWYIVFKDIIKNLQRKSLSHWLVNVERLTTDI